MTDYTRGVRAPAFFFVLLSLHGQGTEPRASAADYPVQMNVNGARFGVEYLAKSFAVPGQTFVLDDFLVVEIAVYPPSGSEFMVSASRFCLRLNGKKSAVFAQTPAMVAASVKYSDWTERPELTAQAPGVLIGRRPIQERFPGDTRPQQRRDPLPVPRVPSSGSAPAPADTVPPHQRAIDSALKEGPVRLPISGFLYFPYRGKLSKLKSVTLVYTAPDGGTSSAGLR